MISLDGRRAFQGRALTFTLAVCLLASVSSCRKVATGPPPPGQLVGLARTAVDRLPEGTGVLMGMSWTQFRQSPLWASMAPKLLALPQVKEVLSQVQSACQIDLVADLDSVLIATPYSFDDSKMVILFKGRWDEDKVGHCIVALVKQLGEGAELTFKKENGFSVFQHPAAEGEAESAMYLAWIAPDTFAVTAAGFDGDTALLAPLLAPSKPMASDAKIMGLMDRVDTSDAVWLVAGPGGFPTFEGPGKDVKGVYANLELGEKAHGYFGTRFDTPARAELEARGGEDFLADQKKDPSIKVYLEQARVFVAGYDVVVETRVSETKVAELAGRLAKMEDGEWLLVLSNMESLMGGI